LVKSIGLAATAGGVSIGLNGGGGAGVQKERSRTTRESYLTKSSNVWAVCGVRLLEPTIVSTGFLPPNPIPSGALTTYAETVSNIATPPLSMCAHNYMHDENPVPELEAVVGPVRAALHERRLRAGCRTVTVYYSRKKQSTGFSRNMRVALGVLEGARESWSRKIERNMVAAVMGLNSAYRIAPTNQISLNSAKNFELVPKRFAAQVGNQSRLCHPKLPFPITVGDKSSSASTLDKMTGQRTRGENESQA